MSDEEVEMVLDRKSRFNRYRTRVRERINLDIKEAMQIDDNNISSTNEISDSEEPNALLIHKVPIVMHDVCTQTLDSLSNPGIEQNFSENIDDEDINQLKGNSNIFQLLNDHIRNNKFKDDDFYEFDYGDTDSIDINDDVE
ncbi:unnamed protein product [Rotaria sp. Silwood2]|nr:unnamed protein product [Rotaria sp. Silwood2]CAF2976153.1 unnamed protein product [Rotaria sp. Silwood2]CAF3250468.1 unnamed protein product [Rotaria sp. Silwood2]CAF3416856.1 unnamed protein product [Rotaria sp. Silwood2]CAF4178612.1 unnamed protein product [Rotaria sp. Silwood2]